MAPTFVIRSLAVLTWVLTGALASHFRGGIFMVRPQPGAKEVCSSDSDYSGSQEEEFSDYSRSPSLNCTDEKEMEISFHISWRRGTAFCDQAIIDSGTVVNGEGSLRCQYGCSDDISSMQFRCTDFSTSEDWSFGENRIMYTFSKEQTVVAIGFTGGNWISPFRSRWNISTTFSLAVRKDTGRINSTPRAITSPVIRLQAGCNHTIRIPTSDPDDDIIRCRWAVGQECGGICSRFPGAVLDPDTCSITYTADRGIGFQAAALMIEDFLPGSPSPMSSVALQFLVFVFRSSSLCSAIPQFIPPTLADDTCVAVAPGGTFSTRLIADSGSTGASITEIQTVSPAGVEKSMVNRVGQTTAYYVNISWTPLVIQEMQTHSFCYTAVNSVGLSSRQVCIDIAAGNTPPTPVLTTPNAQAVHPFSTTWYIEFDQNITRPQVAAYLTFHEMDTNVEVHRIDTSLSQEVIFDGMNQVSITPSYFFEEKKGFYINFERGIVRGVDGCQPGNERVTDSTYWVFETLDVTPPGISLLMAPRASNSNISLSWASNEIVMWQCELISQTQQLDVNCSDARWSRVNLLHGSYQFIITATDSGGNMAQATHRFSIDTIPPTVIFTRMPREFSNQQTVQLRFTCNEGCTADCQFTLDNGSTDVFPCNSRQYTTPSLVHNQTYVFSVEATDQVGNTGLPVSVTWQTDFEEPTVYGVANTSAACTGDVSPTTTGQAEAMDNTTAVVLIRYVDDNTGCFIQRTWEATDSAGNIGSVTQFISLEYSIALDFLPLVSIACDSSTASVQVPSNTASLQNPCRRPVQLTYEETVTEYTCPSLFSRTWEVRDQCNQNTAVYNQSISLYDLCPESACGRNETMPRGVCILGSCACNFPWFGDDCEAPIYPPQVEPVRDVILEEGEQYIEILALVQGTPLLSWRLISAPNRLILSEVTGEITWRRSQVGNYTVTVEVSNSAGSDTVTWNVYVKPGYNAFLDPASEDVFSMAVPLQLTGHVEYTEGNVVKDLLACIVPVTVEITSRNTVRAIRSFTNRDGSFSTVFNPAATEYGSYVAGAKHPGILRATEQTGWDFLGMRASPRFVRLTDSTVGEFKRNFSNATMLINDGPRPLNGLSATPLLGSIQGLTVTFSLNELPSLQPGENLYVDINIETVGAFDADFSVQVDTTEGVILYFTVSLRISQIKPKLIVNPPSANARVVRGTVRNFQFNVTNIGIISASRVRAVLPTSDLISLLSFGNAQQQTENDDFILGSGKSALLSILVRVPLDQPLGDISGEIIISSAELFQRIRFDFLISSNMLMNFTVIVEDEYTYFAEGGPLVGNAIVRLINTQRDIRETLNTAENNGTVTFFNIPEDRYDLFVDAPGHIPVNQIIVTSTEDPVITIFLARRSVTYTWTVVPTTFEETYTISIEADFETHVPIPVVTITPRELSLEPYELGLDDTIQYNITNHGLIRADDLGFELPSGHPFLEFTLEVEEIGSLDALTSIIVPVRVTRSDARQKKNIGSCVAALFYAIGVAYHYVCGDLQTRSASALLRGFSQFSDCGGGGGGGRTVHVIPSRRGSGNGGNDIRPRLDVQPYTTPTIVACNPCVLSVVSCFAQPIGILVSCLPVFSGGDSTFFSKVVSIVECGINFIPGPLSCIYGLFKDCAIPAISRITRSIDDTLRDLVEAFFPAYNTLLLGAEILGDELWLEIEDPNWLSQTLRPMLSDGSDLGTLISETELATILSSPPPNGATLAMVQMMVQRLNNTQYGWANGILEPTDIENMASYSRFQNYTSEIDGFNERAKEKGFDSFIDAYAFARDQYNMIEDFEEEAGVCAVVRIRIEQELALTREAFLAKLEIDNMESASLEEILVEIIITDFNAGTVATHLFSISNVTLSGSLTRTDGGWTLPSSGSGAAEWLIVPLSEAAPIEDHLYNVGGTLSYIINGQTVSVPLLPARITVMPDPSLLVHYFWEKYVVGDNPFTEELEPSVPFTLAVVIQNAGYGVAMNLRITSGQPEIIDNDKGLAVTFKIIGANIGSETFDPSLTVDFGDILANTTKVARWWMISSLQGEFMNYSATFEYMNPLGDPRLSVLDELVIHELIHNVYIYHSEEDDGILDFLANDQNDLFDLPDALYSSKTFQRYNVSIGEVTSLQTTELGIQRVVTNSNNTGWVYFRYNDTQNIFRSTARSINVTKHQDGQEITLPPENAWITRELQKGFGELGSLNLHIFDYLSEDGVVVFTLNPCMVNCVSDERPFEIALPPAAPINLQLSGVSSTWIAFTWEQVPTLHNISNYVITVTRDGMGTNTTVGSGTSHTNVTGLEPTTEYTLQVTAQTVEGQMSHPSAALTALTAPSAPESLVLDAVGVFWISFSWVHNTNATTYIILVTGGGRDVNITIDGSVNAHNVTGLLYDTEYLLRLLAVGRNGQMSLPSHSISTTTLERVLAVPEGLAVDEVGFTWIAFSWQQMFMDVEIARFIIIIRVGGSEMNITVDGNRSSANVTELQPDTEYSLQVISVATDGQSSNQSTSLLATTLIPEFDVFFVNNTPQVQGGISGGVYAEVATNRPNTQLRCRMKRLDRENEDCSSGFYNRTEIPPGAYVLRVTAKDLISKERKVINYIIFVHSEEQYCAVHLINRGWRVEGHNFIVEFSSTGVATGYTCSLNMDEFDCTSPVVLSDLTPGRYAFAVVPKSCSNFRRWKEVFHIE